MPLMNDRKGTTATRAGEGCSAPLAEESHYSVMDCTCRAVSALFILPEHWPPPLSPFPYPSEIYHVRARATRENGGEGSAFAAKI